MPAIQLARLRIQAAQLASLFDQPESFCRELTDLFELYADRVHRPGQSGEPPPLIPRYNISAPLLRHLYHEMAPIARLHADRTLALCDVLWADPFLESRLLASDLLGQAPLRSPDQTLYRVERWASESTDKRLLDSLVRQGLERLRLEQPSILIQQAGSWLGTGDPNLQRLALAAIIPIVEDSTFENLPAIFHLLAPYIRKAPQSIRADIIDTLRTLAKRSPSETAYFLRQGLEISEGTDTPWLIRQTLVDFPPDIRESLREALRVSVKG